MANIERDLSVSPQLSHKEGFDSLGGISDSGGDGSGPLKISHDDSTRDGLDVAVKSPSLSPTDAKSPSNPARPSLVQLGSNGSLNNQPKRFSAVNINKKFLEKNSSTVGPLPSSQSSVNAKSGGSVLARPQVQPPSSHSRLVTTKLTSTSPASSTSGAGWSRPSSAAPPNATGSHSPNDGSPLLPTAPTITMPLTPGIAPLPHTKVIQPQPRPALPQPGSSSKNSSGTVSTKQVWRNMKASQAPSQRPEVRQNDFPTAAEVAQGTTSARVAKANDMMEAAVIAAANKQARIEEADTFRGVHLDPNAHHWDEMEEDDDNFLGGVIEFGDGRQYKIEPSSRPSESPPQSDSVTPPNHVAKSRLDETTLLRNSSSDVPVSKEERFADDFDRSWPRSRTSPASSTRDFPVSASSLPTSARAGPATPISPVMPLSPQEASRVLFNERSNRLEPYSHAQRTGPQPSKRGAHHEMSASPTELKSARDFPPSSPMHSNIQLLQKHGNADFSSRSRRFSGSSSGAIGSGYSGSYQRERDQSLRDEPPHSPRISRNNRDLPETRGQEKDNGERGRRSAMGPPPLPPHAIRRSSREGGRQLPPHLGDPSSSVASSRGQLSSTDPRFTPGGSAVPRPPSQSPVLSHTSAALISPGLSTSSLPQLSAPELDEVRKDVMQSAAARAKQRRQQEEEEREKEKERARRKAAEIEQRMNAEKVEKDNAEKLAESKDDAVIAVIEEAVKTVSSPMDSTTQSQRPPADVRPSVSRTPSLQAAPDTSCSPMAQEISVADSSSVPPPISVTTPAVRAESWRSKPAPSPLPIEVPPKPSIPTFLPPPPSALEQVESLASNPKEELEVVDFLDMGKFVGVTDVPPTPIAKSKQVSSSQSSRPVASDFFDDVPEVLDLSDTKIVAWRQRLAHEVPPERDGINLAAQDNQSGTGSNTLPTLESSIPTKTIDHHVQAVAVPTPGVSGRNPRNQTFYKVATMSALDDVMSRIKGALDGMQTSEATKEVPSPESDSSTVKSTVPRSSGRPNTQKDRWVPPPLRLQNYDPELHEEPVTGFEPPRSPKPAWNAFVIRLPRSTRVLEPIHKKQLTLFNKPVYQARWDILSFDPPVEGMNRRDFTLNDILFGKPSRYRGQPKYRVVLPRLEPRVNIPSHTFSPKTSGGGAFGRPGGADGVATWRKPTSAKPLPDDTTPQPGLNTLSRSPPPDTLPPDPSVASLPVSDSLDLLKADGLISSRPRLQPKMPAGSAVAFYRDSRVDAVEADLKPSVNFIVTSELEELRQTTPVKVKPSITVTSPVTIRPPTESDSVRGVKSLINGVISAENAMSSMIPNKAESKSSEDSTDHVSITPPSHNNSPWTRTSLSIPLKESPARGPDPEHLKAVWSQTSNKSGLHSVNSLEGIADDLTALPFTLHEVKSEDGETPPPTVSAPPSRMSLHEVTKAFQQVPSSSSSSASHRTSPITAPPTTRPPNYAYTLPPPPNNMRPSYGAYPSPMLSHSSNSGVMYPHPMASSPVPNRMPVNGHTPVYNQPMWMSMAGPPQNHGNMMRPMTSPYPAQLMPYPSPGTPAMYGSQPATMQSAPQQQQTGGQANRDRSMSLISPVMPHAAPAMYGSPVLMHAPVMPVPHNPGYMPVQGGRGQVRADGGHLPMQQHSQQPNYLPTQPSYNTTSASFVRSPW